jgi:hypothetical protein
VLALRKEKFNLSIGLVGNYRGWILSLLIQAKSKISAIERNLTFLKKLAYTNTLQAALLPISWVKRLA